ncbi:hypothetical protein CAL7102_00093 [Dulcicalothrix desertica PCC 7102]|nr:hypothetical protein CAL7102_00093 [Dulcicalothrix desertica PCC 7102]
MILLIGKILLLKSRKKQRAAEALSLYVERITSTYTYFFLYFNL